MSFFRLQEIHSCLLSYFPTLRISPTFRIYNASSCPSDAFNEEADASGEKGREKCDFKKS